MVKWFYLLSFFPQPARRAAQPVIFFRHGGLAAVIALVNIT